MHGSRSIWILPYQACRTRIPSPRFRDLKCFVLAILAKIRLPANSSSLLSRVSSSQNAIRLPRGCCKPILIWRSILEGRRLIVSGGQEATEQCVVSTNSGQYQAYFLQKCVHDIVPTKDVLFWRIIARDPKFNPVVMQMIKLLCTWFRGVFCCPRS